MKQPQPTLFTRCLLFVTVFLLVLTGCSTAGHQTAGIKSEDLSVERNAQNTAGRAADDAFITSQMRLATELFRSSVQESKEENVLISPLSVQLALAMTANGADGQTRDEMEQLLGGGISLEELNEYLYTYVKSLPSEEACKLKIADSIWIRDEAERFTVNQDFLQTNADYYDAQVYKAAFDDQTVSDINSWISQHTDNMIDDVLDQIDDDVIMYLINALAFDAEWHTTYLRSDIRNRPFTSVSGKKRNVEMMHSMEYRYLDDGKATGFIKDYKNGAYSFAALLPNEGISIYDYVEGLTGEALLQTIQNAREEAVETALPKFSYEYQLLMNDILKALGMPTAFDSSAADFSGLGTSSRGNIYISRVLHKTFICVDELGTKAGAATVVEASDECAAVAPLSVTLDRPFVYMILDNETGLPVFIGTVLDPED